MKLFKMVLFREFRNNYPTKWSIASQIAKLLLLLVGYWYTAKAFAPNFAQVRGAEDFFTFVVIGECALVIPMTLMMSFAGSLKNLSAEGTLDSVLSMPASHQVSLIYFGLAPVLVEIGWSVFYLLLAVLFFGLRLPVEGFLLAILMQFLALPLFVALGFISAAILLRFGRGEGVLDAVIRAAMVFAGVYFPTSVMPEVAVYWLKIISPFNMSLDFTRKAIAQGFNWNLLFEASIYYLGISLFLLPLGFFVLGIGFNFHRKRGASVLAPVHL
jgi:ABC-2 type transport system permease protein